MYIKSTKKRERQTYDQKIKHKKEVLKDTGASQSNIKLVEKFINSQLRDGKSKQSVLTYLTSLRYVLKTTKFEFSEATQEDIEDFLDTLEEWECESGRSIGKPMSPFTKNNIKIHFRIFLKYIGKSEVASVIKCRNIKNSKLPEDILTKEEVLEIISHAGSLRDKAIFGLLYESGCRAGEILSMKIKNIEFQPNGGCVVTFPTGKTGPRRILIFNFASTLRQWLEAHPLESDPEAPLWPTEDYRLGPLSLDGLRYILRETVKRTNIKKRVWIHGFRHSRATHLSEYLTEQQMKVYLGWTAGSDMPAIYCHLSGRDVDKAVKAMYGIEDNETFVDPMKPGTCARCGEMNAPGANFCFKCGLPLTTGVYEEFNTAKVAGEDILKWWIKNNPDKMDKIIKLIDE